METNSDIILFIIWKKWKTWKKETLQKQKIRKRQILKLFSIWKLMTYKEKACRRIWVRPIFTERQRLIVTESQ